MKLRTKNSSPGNQHLLRLSKTTPSSESNKSTGKSPPSRSLKILFIPTHLAYSLTSSLTHSKLDLRIIPAFWTLYFLASAIRSNIGIAQTMNRAVGHDLAAVLGLSARDTSTALALFYVSYVVFDLPSNLVMSRLSPRVWMARIVTAVGVVGTCFAAVQDPWSVKMLRFLLGVVTAGMWPGMAYYLTLFYPPSRTGKRIGMYFTASQVSAAVVGLVSAGFQQMDGLGGLVGFRWMFLVYGLLGVVLGVALLWWLPDRPLPPGEKRVRGWWARWLPASPEALKGEDAVVHYHDLRRVYHARPWNLRDLWQVLTDWRLWPLTLMYFGVVGVGIGTQLYGNLIISGINPEFTGVQISLLFAPIWMVSFLSSTWRGGTDPSRWIFVQSSWSPLFPTGFTVTAPSSFPPRCASRSPGSSPSRSRYPIRGRGTAVSYWSVSGSDLPSPSA